METTNTYFEKIRKLISQNKLSLALEQLQFLLKNSPQVDEIIQQSARYQGIKDHIRKGTLDFETASAKENQISAAILELLRDIENQDQEISAEIEKTISARGFGSKNIEQNAEKIYNIEKIDKADFS